MKTRFDLQVGITLLAEGGPRIELELGLYLRSEGSNLLRRGQHKITGFERTGQMGTVTVHQDQRGSTTVSGTDLYRAFITEEVKIASFQMGDLELYAFDCEEDGLEGIETIE